VILTVTPNIALDITYHIERLTPHTSTRVSDVKDRAGGKGINVARVLHSLGHESMAVGFAGGTVGAQIREDLDAAGLRYQLLPIMGQTRRSVSIVDATDATVLNEAGPEITKHEWAALVAMVTELIKQASVLVVSGSLPPGVAADGVADLVSVAVAADTPVIADSSGDALLAATAAGPTLIKPNGPEIVAATGIDDPMAAARALMADGAGEVALSLGAEGLCLLSGEGALVAAPSRVVAGNPTGAGDAAVAALALGLAEGWGARRMVGEAVALSAAAVAHPLAGGFDPEVYREMLESVEVKER